MAKGMYYIAKPHRIAKGKLMLIEPPYSDLGVARDARRVSKEPKSAIYLITFGKVPEFIEGDDLKEVKS